MAVPERAAPGQPVSGNVRPARSGDVEFLVEIDGLVNVSPWNSRQFAAACDGAVESTESALVLEHRGRVCGFIIFSSVLDEACIHNLAVHPASQGGRFGRSFVTAALEFMEQDGARRCLLEVRESNTAARGLYEALNFQLDGIRKNYYPTSTGREDARLMSRQL
ncbi:MAG: ribosomal-protein-alanine N-acetyltransferase [Gammaproteobacteria bacterium]|nr:MAG: ribosomal-protein-alanine N-acetyltransferase [Gammaproteobacteria bacterium]RLA58004.1 MAG: ribosomal-protein-alanine N-acetyltransferase [Gammaproteobacteria bacterium]